MEPNEHELNPPSIPSYTAIRKIGRGSYGEVWIYRRDDGVSHAIKIVRKSSFETAKPYQRELAGLRRFAPVSKLHSSQLTVHDVIEAHDGAFFCCVMELADPVDTDSEFDPESYQPQTLRRRINESGELAPERATIIAFQLATALKTLHDAGLIHRDIKPSNIIFVNGVPKLADIGLLTTLETTITSDVGTKSYMPPGEPNSIQSDIYSLGKTFYEMITGLPIAEFPKLPDGILNKNNLYDILEFNEVVMKACAPSRGKRYKSLTPLIKDLSLIQSGVSILKRRRRRVFLERTALAASIAIASISVGILANNTHNRRRDLSLNALEARIADRIHNHSLGQYFSSEREIKAFISNYPSYSDHPRIFDLQNRIKDLPDVDPEPAHTYQLPTTATNIQLTHYNNELLAAYQINETAIQVHNLPKNQILFTLNKPNYDPSILTWDTPGNHFAALWNSATERRLDIYETESKKLSHSYDIPEFWVSDARLFEPPNSQLTYAYLANSQNLHLIHLKNENRSSIPLATQNQTAFTGTNLSESQSRDWIAVWNTNRFDVRIVDTLSNLPSTHRFQHTARVQSLTWAETAPIFTTATHDGALTIWEAPTGKRLAQSKITDEPITQTFALKYPDAQLSITQSGLPIFTQFSLLDGSLSTSPFFTLSPEQRTGSHLLSAILKKENRLSIYSVTPHASVLLHPYRIQHLIRPTSENTIGSKKVFTIPELNISFISYNNTLYTYSSISPNLLDATNFESEIQSIRILTNPNSIKVNLKNRSATLPIHTIRHSNSKLVVQIGPPLFNHTNPESIQLATLTRDASISSFSTSTENNHIAIPTDQHRTNTTPSVYVIQGPRLDPSIDYSERLSIADSWLQNSPDNPNNIVFLPHFLQKLQEHEEAINYYKSALDHSTFHNMSASKQLLIVLGHDYSSAHTDKKEIFQDHSIALTNYKDKCFFHLFQAKISHLKNRNSRALEHGSHFLENYKHTKSRPHALRCNIPIVYAIMSSAAHNLHDTSASQRFLTMAMSELKLLDNRDDWDIYYYEIEKFFSHLRISLSPNPNAIRFE